MVYDALPEWTSVLAVVAHPDDEIKRFAETVNPDGIVAFDSSGVTGHPDHRRATDAACAFARKRGIGGSRSRQPSRSRQHSVAPSGTPRLKRAPQVADGPLAQCLGTAAERATRGGEGSASYGNTGERRECGSHSAVELPNADREMVSTRKLRQRETIRRAHQVMTVRRCRRSWRSDRRLELSGGSIRRWLTHHDAAIPHDAKRVVLIFISGVMNCSSVALDLPMASMFTIFTPRPLLFAATSRREMKSSA